MHLAVMSNVFVYQGGSIAGGRLVFFPRDLGFLWLPAPAPQMPLMRAPAKAKKDYWSSFFDTFVSEPFRAIDSQGNTFNVHAYMARQKKPKYMDLITGIYQGRLRNLRQCHRAHPYYTFRNDMKCIRALDRAERIRKIEEDLDGRRYVIGFRFLYSLFFD